MMFSERSDSALSDVELRALKDIVPDGNSMHAALWRLYPQGYCAYGLGAGTFNRCYRIDMGFNGDNSRKPTVARFNIYPSPNTCASHLEQWVNNEALARRFPTPRIVHVDTSRAHCQYPFQVIEYSDGVPLRGQSEEVVRKALSQLGKALRKLHDTPIGDRFGRVGLGTVPEWDMFWREGMDAHIMYCHQYLLITDVQYEHAYAIGDSDARWIEAGEPRLLHADLSYDNILLDPATKDLKAVIDWEDAVLGDPIFELAGLATFHPEDRHKTFIDAYYEGEDEPADFEYRFWIYYLRIALAKAVHRHRFGYSDSGGEGRQPADGRIALALARLKELV